MLDLNLKKIGLIIVFILSVFSAQAEQKEEKWPEKSCTDLFNAIGLFTALADKEWKKSEEERGAFYASIASDYATIYKVVCKKD